MTRRQWLVALLAIPFGVAGVVVFLLDRIYLGEGANQIIFVAAPISAAVYAQARAARVHEWIAVGILAIPIVYGAMLAWVWGGLFAWAYLFCESGAHDMCQR